MIGAFSPPIAVSVCPRCASWSRWTFVMAATPRSSTFVASSRPPIPTSTMARSTLTPRELDDGGGRQRLELGRRSHLGGDPVDGRQDAFDRRRELGAGDRLAVDRDPLAIA